jgi:hypothetical protein
VTLTDGAAGLESGNRLGDANWRGEDGTIVADEGTGGFLVARTAYMDFEIRAEFRGASVQDGGTLRDRSRRGSGPACKALRVGPIEWRKVQSRAL